MTERPRASFSCPKAAGCTGCPLTVNRRQFLAAASTVATGALAALAVPGAVRAAGPVPRTRIRVVYALHAPQQAQPDWPNKGFDFVPVMERINTALAKGCPDFEFLPTLATGEEQAKKIVADDQALPVDGYLVYQMNCWNRVVQTMAATGKPVLYADFQFGGSGGFLVYTAEFLRGKSPNVGFVASSRTEDLLAATKCFGAAAGVGGAQAFVAATERERQARTPKPLMSDVRADALKPLATAECLRRLKASKILAVRGQESGPAGESMGIQIVHVAFAEVNDAWKAADRDESRAVADRWQKTAARVEGVTRETLESSAAMYLGMKSLLKKHGATGITINCLGGFYGGHIHAYPCLGFHELNNEALVGGCECDVRSAATMVAGMVLTGGRPGFISDPVIDTAKRQIVYAHCVASNRAFGPTGTANPFEILTHSEDRQGASVRSILPVGYTTTTLEFEPSRKEVLFHRASAVANDPDDRACRTKLCAEPVGDIEKLFTMWDQWGWHRVTFYGDLREAVHALADALGWKVVEEA
ncbi:MAG: hypothetical protein ACM3NQ_22765 [Bacteroidales bacterium]